MRSPGARAAGAAAAVASGMVPIALQPTPAIHSSAGLSLWAGGPQTQPWMGAGGPQHDELAGGFDCEHVLSRSVRDTALMLDLTQGAEPGTRYPAASIARVR